MQGDAMLVTTYREWCEQMSKKFWALAGVTQRLEQ